MSACSVPSCTRAPLFVGVSSGASKRESTTPRAHPSNRHHLRNAALVCLLTRCSLRGEELENSSIPFLSPRAGSASLFCGPESCRCNPMAPVGTAGPGRHSSLAHRSSGCRNSSSIGPAQPGSSIPIIYGPLRFHPARPDRELGGKPQTRSVRRANIRAASLGPSQNVSF